MSWKKSDLVQGEVYSVRRKTKTKTKRDLMQGEVHSVCLEAKRT